MVLAGATGVHINAVYPNDQLQTIESQGSYISSFQRIFKNSMIQLALLLLANTYELDIDCRCTILQKTHDFAMKYRFSFVPAENRTHQLQEFNRQGILLIRNPFKAIITYRNYDFGGFKAVAPKESFEGVGKSGL